MAEHHTKETDTLGDETPNDEAESAAVKRREWLQKYFARALGISNEPPPESFLEEVTLEGVAKYIASDKCQKIVTMAGAGISTSAGIPDFRSPGTGLYATLEKYNLPNPQAIFSVDFLKSDPTAFFKLAKERDVLWFPVYKPTPCHYFLRLLNQKGKLLKHFTQNIDTLERVAGLDGDKIIEAHGSVHQSHCMECKKEYSQDWMKEEVFADRVPRCRSKHCGGVVKPDVVFFGEDLPKKFGENIHLLEECDLLIILGTSLVVQPFASLTNRVKENIPRLYINLEKKENDSTHPLMVLMFGGGFNFDGEDNIRDVFWKGTCDDGCYALADYIGWGDELRNMVKQEHARLDKEMAAKDKTKTQASASCKSKGSFRLQRLRTHHLQPLRLLDLRDQRRHQRHRPVQRQYQQQCRVLSQHRNIVPQYLKPPRLQRRKCPHRQQRKRLQLKFLVQLQENPPEGLMQLILLHLCLNQVQYAR